MEIHIDLIPPKEGYFVSVELSDNKSLGFNHTFGDTEIRKQELVGKRYSNEDPDDTWVTLETVNGEPVNKREVEWVDEGDVAIINNDAWKTLEKVDMPDEIHEKLLELTPRIYMNRKDLDSVESDLKELHDFLSERIHQVLDKFSE